MHIEIIGLSFLILVASIVYLIFMFKKGWYTQTIMGIAIAGGLLSSILGIHRLTARLGNEWVGVALLLGGLLFIVISVIAIRKMFHRRRSAAV